jgi:hypothetical protein
VYCRFDPIILLYLFLWSGLMVELCLTKNDLLVNYKRLFCRELALHTSGRLLLYGHCCCCQQRQLFLQLWRRAPTWLFRPREKMKNGRSRIQFVYSQICVTPTDPAARVEVKVPIPIKSHTYQGNMYFCTFNNNKICFLFLWKK